MFSFLRPAKPLIYRPKLRPLTVFERLAFTKGTLKVESENFLDLVLV